MDKFYKKLMNLSKSNITIQNKMKDRLYDKQLLNQVKAIIDQKKINAASNIKNQVNTARVLMEEFTGLDKVHAAQNEVFHYQNEFSESQNKRRELGVKLSSIQMELNDLHNDIVMTDRSDEKYLHLITREHKLNKLEKQLRNDFTMAETEERENFTRFTTKIKESQDKEREQALRTKYWTLFVSTGVTLIGVLGNGVISFVKMHKIDQTIIQLGEETQTLSQNIHSDVSKLDQNQNLMLKLLGQDQSSQSGTKNNSINETEHLQTTLKQLMAFTTQNSAKTESQVRSLTANQTTVVNELKQISKELEMLRINQKEMRNEFLVVGKNKNNDQFVFRNTPNLSKNDLTSDYQSKSSTTSDYQSRSSTTSDSQSKTSPATSSNPVGSISNGIYDKASSLGSGVKQALGYRVVEDYRMPGGDTVVRTDENSDTSSSWTKTIVYFGIFSAVYILATSGVLF